jgi:FkbM family methyltransferase
VHLNIGYPIVPLFNIQSSKTTHTMLKDLTRSFLQKILGFNNYLFAFSLFNGYRLKAGNYEKDFRRFMELLPDEGTVLDIGANIGVMTVALAKKLPHTTVFSFEPVPANIRALERVIRFNRLANVQVFPVALGEKDGTVKMCMPVLKHSRMQGLSHIVEHGDESSGYEYSVAMQRADDIAALRETGKITAIKIDVENYEYYVLKGAAQIIEKHRPLIYCELWDDQHRPDCIAFLEKLGYRVKIYDRNKLVDFTGQPAINFFFLP